MAIGATGKALPPARRAERRFWLAMVVTLAVLVVWGFGGSFFLRGILPHQPGWIDSPHRPLYAANGLAFAAWMALPVAQAALVEGGNVRLHRRLGRLAALILPLPAASGPAVVHHGARHGPYVPGIGIPGLVTIALPGLLVFLLAIGLALVPGRRPVARKRLLLIGTMMVTGAGTARIPAVAALNQGDFDPTQLLVVAMPWQDLHSLGRIHPATLWGGIALLAALFG